MPVARVYDSGKIEVYKKQKIPKEKPNLFTDFEDKTSVLFVHPNQDPSILDWYIENKYKGLVLVGTGLGHLPTGSGGQDKDFPANKNWLPFIKKANDRGIVLIMCSQSLFGRVNDKVYSNLRYVSKEGVLYLDSHDMLFSTAYVKLAIALKKFTTKEKVIDYIKTNVAGEITEKELPFSLDDSLQNL